MTAAKPTSRIEQVSPAMADKYLATMERNRHLRDSRVDFLVALIERGEWRLTNDAITFDTEGRLINGQHRLTALVVSEQTLPILVLRGLPTETQDVMDSGLARKLADALKMRGELYVHALAAGLRWEHRLRYIESGGEAVHFASHAYRPTALALLAIFDASPGPWREAVSATNAMQKDLRIRPGVSSALWLRLLAIDEQDAGTFWIQLVTGVGLEAGSPVLQLRDQLQKTHASGYQKMSDYREAALICKAWNYFRDGEQVGALRWNYGGIHREPFPLPH